MKKSRFTFWRTVAGSVIDDFTRECLALVAEASAGGSCRGMALHRSR
jgi:hypothetical protein